MAEAFHASPSPVAPRIIHDAAGGTAEATTLAVASADRLSVAITSTGHYHCSSSWKLTTVQARGLGLAKSSNIPRLPRPWLSTTTFTIPALQCIFSRTPTMAGMRLSLMLKFLAVSDLRRILTPTAALMLGPPQRPILPGARPKPCRQRQTRIFPSALLQSGQSLIRRNHDVNVNVDSRFHGSISLPHTKENG